MKVGKSWLIGSIVVLSLVYGLAGSGLAGEKPLRIAIVNGRDVWQMLDKSTAVKEAQKVMDVEVKKLQAEFQKEKDELDAFGSEIEKKKSALSKEALQEKEKEYQQKMFALQEKSRRAQFALQDLERKVKKPIINEVNDIIATLAKKEGVTLVFDKSVVGIDSNNGLFYADDALDISDKVMKILEPRFGTKGK